MTTDILFTTDAAGDLDITLDENGDITNGDFFDTSLQYSIYGERRASASEVPSSRRRRGWIGNEFEDYENGSKIWLYEQSKLTRTIMNNLEREGVIACEWMLTDGYAIGSITASATITAEDETGLVINIQRPNSTVEHRYFTLWDNTGISNES